MRGRAFVKDKPNSMDFDDQFDRAAPAGNYRNLGFFCDYFHDFFLD